MFYLYILYSPIHDRYYVGSTEDIHKRLLRHNNGGVTSTKKYRPWQICYTEQFPTRAEAFNREHAIKRKKSRSYIERLVKGIQY